VKFDELLIASIQRSEIPLRFEPGAEEAVANGWTEFWSLPIETRHTRGTGCTYSAAITAALAAGATMGDAIARAKRFIDGVIRGNPGLGHDCGPVNHFAEVQ
jgi:hydroxymethylpyrimidine/phosphomethylpyrimidine kinase